MAELLEEIDLGSKNSANKVLVLDPGIPRSVRKTTYITWNDDSPQQRNDNITYTHESLRRLKIIISITSDSIWDFDLAPELTIKDAAKMAKKFRNTTPHGIVDSDLGPGF